METSDESFVWTDASSDSSINMVAELKQNTHNNECSEDEAYKNKLHNMQPETAMVEHKQRGKKRKKPAIDEEVEQEFQMNNSIKSEPNSDFDIPQTKKKTKNLENISNHYNESYQEAENYLNLRVKQEQMSFVEPAAKKSKKKKYIDDVKSIEEENSQFLKSSKYVIDNKEHISNATSLDNYENCNSSETDIISHRKKKKKKIKEKLSLDENTSEIEHSEDNIKSKKKKVKRKSVVSKELMEEEDSESGNGEIVSSTLINNSTSNNNKEHPNSNTHNDVTLLNSTALENQISFIEGPLKSSCRISDRIRFEEDSADFESKKYVHSEHLSIQLKQFINSSSALMALSPNVQRDSVITEDDEIWLLKTPHEISIGDLDKASLTFDGKRKIKVNGKTYDSFIDNSMSTAPILLCNKNTFVIKNVPLMGVVHLRKRIPKVHIPYETLVVHSEGSFIPLPDTKCRHPLFGINYKKATKIPKNVAERLNTTEAPTISTDIDNKKKKKHKKIKREIESDVDIKPNTEVSRSSKKKRKRKHSEEGGASKAKRAKHAPAGADDWASERAIEENLFNF